MSDEKLAEGVWKIVQRATRHRRGSTSHESLMGDLVAIESLALEAVEVVKQKEGVTVEEAPSPFGTGRVLSAEQVSTMRKHLALYAQSPDVEGMISLCDSHERLRQVLSIVEWSGGAWVGTSPCPYCSREPADGHDADCLVGEVLAP